MYNLIDQLPDRNIVFEETWFEKTAPIAAKYPTVPEAQLLFDYLLGTMMADIQSSVPYEHYRLGKMLKGLKVYDELWSGFDDLIRNVNVDLLASLFEHHASLSYEPIAKKTKLLNPQEDRDASAILSAQLPKAIIYGIKKEATSKDMSVDDYVRKCLTTRFVASI